MGLRGGAASLPGGADPWNQLPWCWARTCSGAVEWTSSIRRQTVKSWFVLTLLRDAADIRQARAVDPWTACVSFPSTNLRNSFLYPNSASGIKFVAARYIATTGKEW